MTDPLHLPPRTDGPIVCDMTTAEDTADERLAEYGRLFERALVRRERDEGVLAFVFRDDPGVRETVESLARREAACCPFLEYRVETTGDEVGYTIINPVTSEERESVNTMLDVMYALAEHAADMDGLRARFAERDVEVVEAEPNRFVLRP
jgi:hypothetical protein